VIADRKSFTDLTVHLKRASDALLRTAQRLATLCRAEPQPEDHAAGALDELIGMAIELAAMERILRAVMEANHAEEPLKKASSRP
jgi:hypothetical protein